MELFPVDILDVKIQESSGGKTSGAVKCEKMQQWEKVARKVANDIRESRKPFEDAIAEKQNRLQLLENYSSVFSDNRIIYLKKLPLRSYNIMAM